VRSFVIPHIPHDDVVLPEEVQGLRAFGSETEMESIAGVMARHLETMRNKHAITLEHLRMGALKGVILDADGSVIYDLYKEFEIKKAEFNFDLGKVVSGKWVSSDIDVRGECANVLRQMEDSLLGEYMNGVHCLCSPEFFDALVSHKNVKEAYSRYQQGIMLINDVRAGFTFGGITFSEYRGQATDASGVTRRFIEAGEAHCFPLGTIDTFGTYFAPADFNETANTLGQTIYAKQEPRKFDRGTDLHTQSKPIDKGLIYKVLNNRTYLGELRHKEQWYQAEHPAIIDRAVWDQVHAILATNGRVRGNATRATVPYLLKGMVFGNDGRALSPFHTTKKNGRRYRYYVPQRENKEHAGASGLPRLPAGELESAVLDQLRAVLRSPNLLGDVLPRAIKLDPSLDEAKVTVAMTRLDAIWDQLFPAEQTRIVKLLVEKVIVSPNDLEVRLRANGIERLVLELKPAATPQTEEALA